MKRSHIEGDASKHCPFLICLWKRVRYPDREIFTFDEPGELCVKGPQVMKRYHNRPVESAAAFKDGWFLTGDIATVDEERLF